jgi:AraC-like DNA-binding protein
LIRAGDLTLADIAAAVGFCDQAHFTRAFKAQHGVTPAAFRKDG